MHIRDLTLKHVKEMLESTENTSYQLFSEATKDNWKRSMHCSVFGLNELWGQIESNSREYLERPLEAERFSQFQLFGSTGDRKTFEKSFLDCRRRMSHLALMCMIDDNPVWVQALEDTLWAICGEYTWVMPAHIGLNHKEYPNGIWDQPNPPKQSVDLTAASLALDLAEITSLLKDKLHPWIVDRVRNEIDRRVLQVFFADASPQNWEMKNNNWPSVCASTIASAAIYFVSDSRLLAGMLWRCLQTLRSYIDGFDEQGATPEGIAYFQYGFSKFMTFSELLRERTGGKLDLLKHERIRSIAQFPSACILSNGKTFNFSDCAEDISLFPGYFKRLSSRYPEANVPQEALSFKALEFAYWSTCSRSMLWSMTDENKAVQALPVNDVIFSRYYADHQWVVSKREIDGRLVAFAAKGGHNEEPHNHNDLGHFIIHCGGENRLCDIGLAEYTRQYFQPELRYDFMNAGSQGHSVPLLNGRTQGWGRARKATAVQYEERPDGLRYTMNLEQAYEVEQLDKFKRSFHWESNASGYAKLLLTDEFQWKEPPQSIVEVFICNCKPKPVKEGEVNLDGVMLYYDASSYQYNADQIEVVQPNGSIRTAYRLLLSLTSPSEHVRAEFQFLCVRGEG